ncbi:hypothetical protein GCM10010124_29010 [Pilimelia terevasa]|uniref:Methyltransferase domain-containing protein n=2 Tax=Pilimelia terevasa TaxID=53372 RepID=A0A8J3BS61_9ACTN|nr:hypothetical protein GCM10010124_29010 [Pilimelia terevasa]
MSAADYAALRAAHDGAVLDVGTGDGKHAQHLARQHPDRLVVGLDAARDNMRAVSAKAAARRSGLPNLIYVWAAAESLPPALHDITDVHVLMPWGSLLRGVVGADPQILGGLRAVCAPGAGLYVALNLHAWRPPVPEVGGHPEPTPESALATMAAPYAAAGWTLADAAYLDTAGVAALATSWTRRLSASRARFDVLAVTGARAD